MTSSPTTDKIVPYALLGITAVTGLVDAVSFLSLGRVFTANMTCNIVILPKRLTGRRQTTSTLYAPVRGASVACKSNFINSLSGVLRADSSRVVRIAAANR
jgi:Protein of unknown function (DUF1275)